MLAIIKVQPCLEYVFRAVVASMSLTRLRADLVRTITAGRDAGKDMSEPQKTLDSIDAVLQFTMIDTQLIGHSQRWPAYLPYPVAFVHSRDMAMLFRMMLTVREQRDTSKYVFSAFPITGSGKDAVVHVVLTRKPLPPQYKCKYRALEMILTIDRIMVYDAQAKDIIRPMVAAALVHIERVWQGPGSLRHIGELVDDNDRRTFREQLDGAYAEVGMVKLVFSHTEEQDEIQEGNSDDDAFSFNDDDDEIKD